MRSQVFLLPPPLLQRSAPVSRRLFSLFVRTCHVPRVAPVHEPVRQPEGGEELGLASEEVAEVLLEAPRALVGGGEEGDCFLGRFFFFWRVSRKGFRERERERSTNRARKTAASPLSCWRERKGPTCACCYRVAQTGARKKKNPPSPGASDERRRRSEEEAFFVADDVEPPTTLAERGVFKGAGALFAVCVGGRATAHGATARRVIMALFISARSRSG